MSSEYIDEIKNSSYTRRAFSYGKSKYLTEGKLLILNGILREELRNRQV